MCWGSGIYVHGGLATQPQGHVGTHASAERTFSTCHRTVCLPQMLLSLRSLAPVVASVDMAASEVDPRLTLFKADINKIMLFKTFCFYLKNRKSLHSNGSEGCWEKAGFPTASGCILQYVNQHNLLAILTHNALHSRSTVTESEFKAQYSVPIVC